MAATTTAPSTEPTPEDRLESWRAAPAEPASVDDIPRLLPTASIAPAGVPVRGQADGASAAQATFTQVFADADRDILLTLQSQPAGTDSTPSEMRQPVTIDGWDDAYGTDGSLRLVAMDPSGLVRLAGTGIDADEAGSIIAAMQRRAVGIPGCELSAAFDGLVEINGAWNDSSGQRFVTWFDGDRVVAHMLTSPDYTDLISQALGPAFEKVDVNGADGWVNANGGRRSVVWSPDGTTIVVLGVADERINPLAVARSLTELGIADFESATTTEIPAGVGDGCDGSLFCWTARLRSVGTCRGRESAQVREDSWRRTSMAKKFLLAMTIATASLVAPSLPAGAITNGDVDTTHDYVGAMTGADPGGTQRLCSGSLIAKGVFLTAGHCTVLTEVKVTFGDDLSKPDYVFNATAVLRHPQFSQNFGTQFDVGLVLFDQGDVDLPFGTLAGENYIDGFTKPELKSFVFETFGYQIRHVGDST